ncbi:hypothetical protein ABZ619_09970 [Streptomyces sp. NPDC007851]|uniref:hypothetical protein n=1 Tax=Streptomyces sp. NPDC007851 TaxID=3155008 RepID=UPI0034024277
MMLLLALRVTVIVHAVSMGDAERDGVSQRSLADTNKDNFERQVRISFLGGS